MSIKKVSSSNISFPQSSFSLSSATNLNAVNRTFGFAIGGNTVTNYQREASTFRCHTYTTAGIFEVTVPGTFEYLIVGGGGGGAGGASANGNGSGGGGGGASEGLVFLDIGKYLCLVGSGGQGGGSYGKTGQTSSITNMLGALTTVSITATGGGVGQSNFGVGASSGTGRFLNGTSISYAGGSSAGGDGAGGGGGGARQVGTNGSASGGASGGKGGDGVATYIRGTLEYYGGGGGGSRGWGVPTAGTGGLGGGGGGNGGSGSANTGGGGAGTANASSDIRHQGGSGGTGIIIIRYKI